MKRLCSLKLLKWVSLFFLIFCVIPHTVAERSSSPNINTTSSGKENRAIEILKLLEREQEKIENLEVEFFQIRTSGLMLEDIFSKATFYFKKPDKFRCEYLPPDESINLINANVAYIYTPEINQVEKYELTSETEVKKLMSQILIGFGGSVEKLSQEFDINSFDVDYTNDFNPTSAYSKTTNSDEVIEGEDPKYTKARNNIIKEIQTLKPDKNSALIEGILLKAKQEIENPIFQEIKLWIDVKSLQPIKIFLKENEEDSATVFIKTINKNKSIDDSLFQPNFPKDAEIIEPQME